MIAVNVVIVFLVCWVAAYRGIARDLRGSSYYRRIDGGDRALVAFLASIFSMSAGFFAAGATAVLGWGVYPLCLAVAVVVWFRGGIGRTLARALDFIEGADRD